MKKIKGVLWIVSLICLIFPASCARQEYGPQSSGNPTIAIPSKASVKLLSGKTFVGSFSAIETDSRELVITAGPYDKSIPFNEIAIVVFEPDSPLPSNDDRPVLRGSESWEIAPLDAFEIKTIEPLIADIDPAAVTPIGSSRSLSTAEKRSYVLNSMTFDSTYPIMTLVLSTE